MRLHIYSGNRIEPWDYRNVFEKGIGGSETSHVELAIRLAKRGHKVTSYTQLPAGSNHHTCYGVEWADLTWANFESEGLWIIYRQPSIGAQLPEGCRAWLVCQDVFYPDWKPEDVAHFEKIIGLCPRHLQYLRDLDPSIADKLVLSGNGVNVERIERAEQTHECSRCGVSFSRNNDLSLLGYRQCIACDYKMFEAKGAGKDWPEPDKHRRDPKRLIWASSPDRGLKELLDIFERAREQVDGLNLHIFYGLDNIEKICGGDRTKYPWRESWKQYDRALAMKGVVWEGRIGQERLAVEYLKSGIWCYPTWFQETSCISCMEAQSLGAIPITNPIWATGYNVKHGIFIEGTPSDRLVLSRYVDAVVRVALNHEGQEGMRSIMMPEARQRLSWETVADQWHAMATSEVRDAVGA
jgi:glycosyltransferase involved in cell wall biosynthesis